VLLRNDVPITHGAAARSLFAARTGTVVKYWSADTSDETIDPLVQRIVGATNGNLYRYAIGKLRDYPIPELRLPVGRGERLLDVGCNWGRWSIAAARKGYQVVGIDPDLEALVAASRVAKSLGLNITFLCADARYLPFPDASFTRVFSYSVIQHFGKADARAALAEVSRVLEANGQSMIQMPNAFGVRSVYHQARRGFHVRSLFDVRYWTPRELTKTFTGIIGPTTVSVDGFFGLGVQTSDVEILPRRYRVVVRASEGARRLATALPPLRHFADSLYLHSRRCRS
jgi:2-polyprenyl-3-methyl-5-hydroxy-6-metoxy-1,4-benzoquinol methylase